MNEAQLQRLDWALARVRDEVIRAAAKHGSAPFNSTHEGYAVLLEEVEEAWDEIKANETKLSVIEMTQVGAMAIRYITSFGREA